MGFYGKRLEKSGEHAEGEGEYADAIAAQVTNWLDTSWCLFVYEITLEDNLSFFCYEIVA